MRPFKAIALVALAVLAFGSIAAGARAAEWAVGSKTFAELKVKEEKTTLSGQISILVPKLSVTVKCSTTSGSGKAFEGGSGEVSASLSGCEVSGAPSCTVIQPIELKAKTTAIAAGENYYDSLAALEKEGTLAKVNFKGEKCALPLENTVKGTVAGQPSWGQDVKWGMAFSEAISSTANEALAKEEKAKLELLFGKNTAFLVGELGVKLSGVNAGKEWQGTEFTRLCEIPQSAQNTCPALHYYPEEQELKFEKETEFKFDYGTGNTACATAKLVGMTHTDGAAPVEATFSTMTFGAACGGGCVVTAVISGSYLGLITTIGDGDGNMDLIAPEFKIVCGATTCVYSLHNIDFYIYHGAPAKMYSPPENMTKVSGPAACAATGTLKGNGPFERFSYELEVPGSLYVTG